MPKLWSQTIDAHRRSVRDAVLDAAEELLGERGPASWTMSEIAGQAGIGRATLYKYFPDVQAVAHAWHERLIHRELERLVQVSRRTSDPGHRLRAVLETYADIHRERPDHHLPEGAALLLHHGPTDHRHAHAHAELRGFLSEVLASAAEAGQVRRDVPPQDLAAFCLHALRAASEVSSKSAVDRLVEITLAGLQAPD